MSPVKSAKPARVAKPVSPEDLKEALDSCLNEISAGASPAKLTDDAVEFYRQRYEPLFKKNLNKPQVGGWKRVAKRLREVSRAFGAIARDIAAINGGKVIGHDLMLLTSSIVEAQCRIGMEGNEEGQVCN